jgi:NAD(P)-dependent dehydrogenase (short-subunit alcohol dehydrogenase family)
MRRPTSLRVDAAAVGDAAADSRPPVCLVVGAGAGVGQAVARRFAREGYHVCVVRRGGGRSSLSDDSTKDKFAQFVESIRQDGGSAQSFFACVATTGRPRADSSRG